MFLQRLLTKPISKSFIRSFHSINVNGITLCKKDDLISYTKFKDRKTYIECSYVKIKPEQVQDGPKLPPNFVDIPYVLHDLKVNSEKFISLDDQLYILEGSYKQYDENGKLWKDVIFYKGLIHGHYKSFRENQLIVEVNCIKGIPHGVYRDSDSEMYYKEGMRDGLYKRYNSFGVLQNEIYYEKGVEKWSCYHYLAGHVATLSFRGIEDNLFGTEIELRNYDDNLVRLSNEIYRKSKLNDDKRGF